MRAWVYAWRSNARAADRFAEELRASGEYVGVTRVNARWYDGIVHRNEVVFHDGTVQALVMAHEDAGVPCRRWDVPPPAPTPEPAPAPVPEGFRAPLERFQATDPHPTEPAGHVEQTSPGWWKAFGPDGEQIGGARRSQGAAEALLAGEAE